MANFLALSKVCKSFVQGSERVLVLNDLNFNFDFTKTYAIIGSSGSGKSTLIHLLAGTDQPDSGTVNWCDKLIINKLTASQKAVFWNQQVGLVFQQANLINELTVLENVLLKGLIGNITNAKDKAVDFLEQLGLGHRLDFFPDVLSRGEQQRVAIARAIMCNSGLILADEPTASLDRLHGEQVIAILISLARKYQIGLIVSTHDEYVYHQMDQVVHIIDCKLNLTS